MAEKHSSRSVSTVIFLGVAVAFTLWLARPLLLADGYPWGTDVYGHLARVWYLAKTIAATGSIPSWFPYWYSGTPLLQYYPPLATLVMVPLQWLTGNITLTYRVFVVACLIPAAVLAFILARRRVSPGWAGIAAVLYVGAPYTVRTVFDEGNLPRTLTLIWMPLLLLFVLNIWEHGSRRSFCGLIVTTCLLLLTHHEQGGLILGSILLLSIVHGIKTDSTHRFRAVLVWAAILIGIGLAGFWLIPALTHADYATVPDTSLLPERMGLMSVSWSIFNPMLRTVNIESVYFGIGLVLLGTIAAWIFPSRWKTGLFLVLVVNVILAFGINNPLYRYLPLGSSLFPERFLNFAALLVALLISEWGNLCEKWKLRIIPRGAIFLAVSAVLIWDASPYWTLAKVAQYPDVQSALSSLPARGDLSRLDLQGVPGGSIWAFAPLEQNDQALAFGWSIETTPHLPDFSLINTAIRNSFPQYVLHLYSLWNVREAVLSKDEDPLRTELTASGFTQTAAFHDIFCLNSPSASSPVLNLNPSGLVIGRGAETVAQIYPWMNRGNSWFVDENPDAYYAPYQIIYLYDFRYHNLSAALTRIRSWVAGGKQVVIDMTGLPGTTVFDVQAQTARLPRTPVFLSGPDIDFTVDSRMADEPFEYNGADWQGVSYLGLDGNLIQVTDAEGNERPVLGYKQIPEGKVYFLGFNWAAHIQSTRDRSAANLLDGFFQRANPDRSIALSAFPIQSMQPPADRWYFTYQADQPAAVVVSQTWSPHWRVTVDGTPTDAYNLENLNLLYLPAGTHRVEFTYESTLIQWAGWGVTIAILCLAVFFWGAFPRMERWSAQFEGWAARQIRS
jgi:uncharacterized membrane protein